MENNLSLDTYLNIRKIEILIECQKKKKKYIFNMYRNQEKVR